MSTYDAVYCSVCQLCQHTGILFFSWLCYFNSYIANIIFNLVYYLLNITIIFVEQCIGNIRFCLLKINKTSYWQIIKWRNLNFRVLLNLFILLDFIYAWLFPVVLSSPPIFCQSCRALMENPWHNSSFEGSGFIRLFLPMNSENQNYFTRYWW